jgi:predicted ATP-grasp superfamily ATP-dependent carboligase
LRGDMQIVDVLITYGWVRSSYAALRNLSSHSVRVAVSDSHASGMCQSSRLKKAFIKYRNPFTHGHDPFIQDLLRAVEKTRPRMLLPSHDETEIIAKYRQDFPSSLLIPLTDYDSIVAANDKARMHEYAGKIGIEVPKSYAFSSVSELRGQLSPSDPYVVKLRRGNSAKGVFYAEGAEGAARLAETTIAKFNLGAGSLPIVQDRVYGEGWGVSCLYWHGKRIASFTHKRLREKIATGGTSTLREGRDNPIIEAAAHRLLDSLAWHGLVMVEFKYDPNSGKYWFIETNPRLWGSMHLAIASGVEFPYLLYLCATEGPDQAIRYLSACKKRQLVARWYLGDLITCASSIKDGGNILSSLKLCLPGGADTYDDFFMDDLSAFCGEIRNYAGRFLATGSLNPAEGGTLG